MVDFRSRRRQSVRRQSPINTAKGIQEPENRVPPGQADRWTGRIIERIFLMRCSGQSSHAGYFQLPWALVFHAAAFFAVASGFAAPPVSIDIDLPSPSTGVPGGTLAVRVFSPATGGDARYRPRAPVLIYVPGGSGNSNLTEELLRAPDMIRIVFLFPGGIDPGSGRTSDGTYDYRGQTSIEALRDVILYASGQLADSTGQTLQQRVAPTVLTDNIGLVGGSNGGNIVVAVAGLFGNLFQGHLRYIVQWESPVSSQMATVDLGGIRLECAGAPASYEGVNPRYTRYGSLAAVVDYQQLQYDPNNATIPVFFDGNGDGIYTTVPDPINTGCLTPDINGDGTVEITEDWPLSAFQDDTLNYYSRAATKAMDAQNTFGGSWPATIANLSQAQAFWDLREAVRLYDDAMDKIPGLEGLFLTTLVDHVQETLDYSHIHQGFDGWNLHGAWMQINPSSSYLVAVDPALTGRTDLPDNAHNTPPADWTAGTAFTIPEDVGKEVLFAASVWQMADRVEAKRNQQPPILVTFDVHFDPVLANLNEWLGQRDNLAWLRDEVASFADGSTPWMNLGMQGDHAEFYQLPTTDGQTGRAILDDLLAAGHSPGTHIHKSTRGTTPSSWVTIQPLSGGHPCTDPDNQVDHPNNILVEVLNDHFQWTDGLWNMLGEPDSAILVGGFTSHYPGRYDNKQQALQGTLTDGANTVSRPSRIETGGRDECLSLFFDHDVMTPWRQGASGPMAEDLSNHYSVVVPGLPDVGELGTHFSSPVDATVPAYQRRFVQSLLERKYAQYTGSPAKPWTFGFHIHPHTLYPDSSGKDRNKRLRGDLDAFLQWMAQNHIQRTDAQSTQVADYANFARAADEYRAWEIDNPGASLFQYNLTSADWNAYPYALKGLAKHLANAHYASAATAATDQLQVTQFHQCPHSLRGETPGYWGRPSDTEIGCYDAWSPSGGVAGNPVATTTVWVAWRDAATAAATDLSTYLPADVTAYDGVTGDPLTGQVTSWSLGYQPVIFYAAPATPTPTSTVTSTATATATTTATPTATAMPATETPTYTATATPTLALKTATPTMAPGTATSTPTATATGNATSTPTLTPVVTTAPTASKGFWGMLLLLLAMLGVAWPMIGSRRGST